MRWQDKSYALLVIVFVWTAPLATAFGRQESAAAICDTSADFFLGAEDYPEAIRLHLQVLKHNPNSALAHYHLGFAQGMICDRTAEVREYQRAEALGLRTWDLFLNLGLAQLENGNLDAATDSLRRAVLLGEDHSESHFNLALVYAGGCGARGRELVREAPDYEPARKNLAILRNQSEVALGETAVVVPLSGRRQSHQR